MFESEVFYRDYTHAPKLVNCIIRHIKKGGLSKKSDVNLKYLVFRMMKVIVLKNCNNYYHLMRNTKRPELMPDMPELIADCYEIMCRCFYNYDASGKYDFYFYYNKALSRHWFKKYQTNLATQEKTMELTDLMYAVDKKFVDSDKLNMEFEMLLDSLGIDGLKRDIVYFKLSGELVHDFTRRMGITRVEFNSALEELKKLLKGFMLQGEL